MLAVFTYYLMSSAAVYLSDTVMYLTHVLLVITMRLERRLIRFGKVNYV